MDKLLEKIEEKFSNTVDNFEKNPLKESIKILILFWVIKKVVKWMKENA